MKITKTVELADGRVEFTGELSGVQLDAILTVGIETLLRHGAMPYIKNKNGSIMVDDLSEQKH